MNSQQKQTLRYGTIATLVCLFALEMSPCDADPFGPETPITLPTISAKELRVVEKQLANLLPRLTASCVRVDVGGLGRSSSGVIISPNGLVLTHCHGGETPGTKVHVQLSDDRKVAGEFLGVHRNFDLALVRIHGDGPWPSVPVGAAKRLSVGQCCFALSYPAGFNNLVSPKPVLRLSRILEVDPRNVYTGIPVRPGDSGGPMFSVTGNVIGIAHGTDRDPVSYYTRADLLAEVYDDLLSGVELDNETFAALIDKPRTSKGAVRTSEDKDRVPIVIDVKDSDIPASLSAKRQEPSKDQLPEFRERLQSIEKKIGPAMVAIFDRRTKRQVGSGTIIDETGIVLTHGTGVIGPKRIGRTFDVKVGNGKVTTGKYLGVNRGYRLSVMQLEKSEPWPVAKIGNPAEIKAGSTCVMLSCPAKHSNKTFSPILQPTRALSITDNRIYTPLEYPSAEAGAALVSLDGMLVGVKTQSSDFARADRFAMLKEDLLAANFVPKFRYPLPFGNLDLSDMPVPVHKSVVRVVCEGKPVAFGIVVTADGNIVTKASALTFDRIQCEFGDGRKMNAKLLGRSWRYDIAVLDIDANELAVAELAEGPPVYGAIVSSIGIYPAPLSAGVLGTGVVEVPRDTGQFGFSVGPNPKGNGVRVSKVLYALTRTVLNLGDVITELDDKTVNNMEGFDDAKKSLFQSQQAFAGERVSATIRRGGKNLRMMIPIELGNEHHRIRPITDSIAPILPDDLQGRHNGFPSVLVHDAMVRTPCKPVTIITPNAIPRSHLGSPVVNLSGKVVGINIASHRGTFACAISADAIVETLGAIRKSIASRQKATSAQ